jgi:hypothetical protein
MNHEAYHLREQAQNCLFLAWIAEEGELGDLLRGVARDLVTVAERLEDSAQPVADPARYSLDDHAVTAAVPHYRTLLVTAVAATPATAEVSVERVPQ